MKSISKIFILLALVFTIVSCSKEVQHSFTVGDITDVQQIATTEGGYETLKINSFSDGLPNGVSLSWNELQGLTGNWEVTMRYSASTVGTLKFTQGGSTIKEVKSKVGTQKVTFDLKAVGDPLQVRVSGDGGFGVQLIFKQY